MINSQPNMLRLPTQEPLLTVAKPVPDIDPDQDFVSALSSALGGLDNEVQTIVQGELSDTEGFVGDLLRPAVELVRNEKLQLSRDLSRPPTVYAGGQTLNATAGTADVKYVPLENVRSMISADRSSPGIASLPPEASVGDLVVTDPVARLPFTPFRFRLYDKKSDGPLSMARLLNMIDSDDISNLSLLKGRYIFGFTIPRDFDPPFTRLTNPVPIEVEGKKVTIEKVQIDPNSQKMMMQVNLIENPIPLLILIGVAGAGLGLAGWGLADTLESVDRVLVDITDTIVILSIIAGVGFVFYQVFKPKKRGAK